MELLMNNFILVCDDDYLFFSINRENYNGYDRWE